MSNLTLKQKIILGVIIGIMLIVIGIYGYISLNNDEGDTVEVFNDEIINSELINDETINNGENGELINESRNESFAQNNQENGSNKDNLENGQEEQTAQNGYQNLEGKIVIHITGNVKKTGILILPEGARIADAIDAAGGATEKADLDEVNLAHVLEDGQKIYIPSKEDKEKGNMTYITSESGNNVIVESKTSNEGVNKIVNINTATQSELETLPGIGTAMANRIIEYREANGQFQKIEDLQNVKGIGDAKFANIKEHVTVK